MALLTDLDKKAPSSEALIRVYATGQLILTAEAKRVLKLDDSSKLAFRVAGDGPCGTKKIFVGKRKTLAYRLHPVGRRYRIRSASLCRQIATSLQGYGTYRIEEDVTETDYNGDVYHSIFFRKYL